MTWLQKQIPLAPLSSGVGGWWPVVREPYTGAWQRNDELRMDTALSFSAVFACTTLIVSDIGKLTLRLVEQSDDGIWIETENPAFSPVLRRPNRYQNISQFIETWVASLLNSGNTYVLKVKDRRNVVVSQYVLDPTRVRPLVAQDGSVYYELKRDDLSDLPKEMVVVPASEIIHDRMNCLFHPLVGLSPIFAAAVSARQGLSIQNNSSKLFANGSVPSGVVTAPGDIGDVALTEAKAYWNSEFSGDNVGRVAILGNGAKFEQIAYRAIDMQLIEQLDMSAKTVCACYHVPPYLVDLGPAPPYANIEPVLQKYYSQCLQARLNGIERSLDEGIGLGRDFGNRYGTEFDPDDLIWMDAAAKSKAAQDGIGGGGMSTNEARKRYHGLPPVKGGESPLSQAQYYSLEALAERDANDPFAKPEPQPRQEPEKDDDEEDDLMEASLSSLHRKALEHGLYR